MQCSWGQLRVALDRGSRCCQVAGCASGQCAGSTQHPQQQQQQQSQPHTCGENCSMRRAIWSAAASSMAEEGLCSSVANAQSVLAISWLVYWCSMPAARRAAVSSRRCPGLYASLE